MKISSKEIPAVIELEKPNILIVNNLRDMIAHKFTLNEFKSITIKIYNNFFEVIFNKNISKVYHNTSWSFYIV